MVSWHSVSDLIIGCWRPASKLENVVQDEHVHVQPGYVGVGHPIGMFSQLMLDSSTASNKI
jgi:hypothetical protein